MRKIAIYFLLFSSIIHAQIENTLVENRYLEDQIYLNATYIQLLNTPDNISQTGFSYGLGLGVIKDLPVNFERNMGFGIGIGYAANTYFFNVKEITDTPSTDETNELKSNKVSMHTVEFPFELRLRTSTAEKYNFWRLYPGIKMAYVFATNSNLKQSEDFDLEEVIQVNKFLYGFTVSAGYNKWNFHLYYGINELFSTIDDNNFNAKMNDLRLGLIFYIL